MRCNKFRQIFIAYIGISHHQHKARKRQRLRINETSIVIGRPPDLHPLRHNTSNLFSHLIEKQNGLIFSPATREI